VGREGGGFYRAGIRNPAREPAVPEVGGEDADAREQMGARGWWRVPAGIRNPARAVFFGPGAWGARVVVSTGRVSGTPRVNQRFRRWEGTMRMSADG